MQSRFMSLVEVILGTLIGLTVATAANYWVLPQFGFTPSLGESLEIAIIFTVISVLRGYFVRRLFNLLHLKGVR